MKRVETNIKRSQSTQQSKSDFDDTSSRPRVELGSRRRRMLATTFISALPYPQQQFSVQLQTFIYENILGNDAKRLPAARNLPSLQGAMVVPYQLLRVAYVSLLDSRDGTDVMRINPNWFGTGPRHDFALIQDDGSNIPWFAQLLEVFTIEYNGSTYRIAYIEPYETRARRNKYTGYIELKDRKDNAFIFVDSIACIRRGMLSMI
ncbi:hypothetical protein FRC09_015589 [Ceratobasidium sp. 395]|nr:hypothetical protein FRC09_015589 [Ceratobasidium sp. 395]